MKKILKISQIQFQGKSHPLDNLTLLKTLFKKSLNFNPDLITTPECTNIITNNKISILKNANFENDCPILNYSKQFAKNNKININLGSLLLKTKNSNKLVNRSFLINRRGIIQKKYDKIHLFDVKLSSSEIHKESILFASGKKIVLTKIEGIIIGLTICYDLRFPELFRFLTKKGAQVILVPSAFTVPTGKDHWKTLLRARSIENSVFIVATGQCGLHESSRKTYGHSMIIDPWGKILNSCLAKPKILNTKINIKKIKDIRSKLPTIFNL